MGVRSQQAAPMAPSNCGIPNPAIASNHYEPNIAMKAQTFLKPQAFPRHNGPP